MLTIHVVMSESFDEATNQFVAETFTLELEHSLASMSKWESHWEKPFLSGTEKTPEETLSYIMAMVKAPHDVPMTVFQNLSESNIEDITRYINSKQTATWFREDPTAKKTQETITAEIIYYWMSALQISMECQYWHLSKLLAFIRVCNEKNAPPKKVDRREAAARQRQLNAERRAKLGSKG